MIRVAIKAIYSICQRILHWNINYVLYESKHGITLRINYEQSNHQSVAFVDFKRQSTVGSPGTNFTNLLFQYH